MKEIENHCEQIAKGLSNPDFLAEGGPEVTAFDYLESALDIRYIVNGSGDYLGAQVCVAFGGPTIWVNTLYGRVEGAWWQDHASVPFVDEIGLDDTLRELWECR